MARNRLILEYRELISNNVSNDKTYRLRQFVLQRCLCVVKLICAMEDHERPIIPFGESDWCSTGTIGAVRRT